MPTIEEDQQRLMEIIRSTLNNDSIGLHDRLHDHGICDLDFIRIEELCRDEFCIEFPDEADINIDTADDILDLIKAERLD